MEEASPPDSTSATQLPVAVSQSLLPIKRTSSGRPATSRLTHRSMTSPSAPPLHLDSETIDQTQTDETNPFPPLEKWWAVQVLKDNSDKEILRWLYYARCPDSTSSQPPHESQTTPQPQSSPFSTRDLQSAFASPARTRDSKASFASAPTAGTQDSKASFASAPTAGTRDSKSSFASFLSTRTPHSDRSSFTDYSFNDSPPLPISKSASNDDPLASEHRRLIKSPSLQKKLPLPPKYFCTSCDANGFGRKGDWKSHETEFHEHQEEYKCNFCDKMYHRKHRFIRHHAKAHCRNGCQHAETCRKELPKKRAWGCGFCVICLTDRSHRDEHIAGHYEDGKKKSDWNHSLVILGLLKQPCVYRAWLSLTCNNRTSDYAWSEQTAAELQVKLETEGQQTGYNLACAAHESLLRIKSVPTEATLGSSGNLGLSGNLGSSGNLGHSDILGSSGNLGHSDNLGSSGMAWSEYPANTSSPIPLQHSLANDNDTVVFQNQGQYLLSKFNPRSDSLSNLAASTTSMGLQPLAFDSLATFQPRHDQAPSHYPETDSAFTCDGIKFPRVPNETENVDPRHAFQQWYPESSTSMDLSPFTDNWGHPQ